jgi:hypothetical protein
LSLSNAICYGHSDWSKYMTLTNENTGNVIVILSKMASQKNGWSFLKRTAVDEKKQSKHAK